MRTKSTTTTQYRGVVQLQSGEFVKTDAVDSIAEVLALASSQSLEGVYSAHVERTETRVITSLFKESQTFAVVAGQLVPFPGLPALPTPAEVEAEIDSDLADLEG